MVNEMIKLTTASIVLSSLWAVAALPAPAQAAADIEQTTPVWSSRDGLLRFIRTPASDPEVETVDEPSGEATDASPSPPRSALVCEPFK